MLTRSWLNGKRSLPEQVLFPPGTPLLFSPPKEPGSVMQDLPIIPEFQGLPGNALTSGIRCKCSDRGSLKIWVVRNVANERRFAVVTILSYHVMRRHVCLPNRQQARRQTDKQTRKHKQRKDDTRKVNTKTTENLQDTKGRYINDRCIHIHTYTCICTTVNACIHAHIHKPSVNMNAINCNHADI